MKLITIIVSLFIITSVNAASLTDNVTMCEACHGDKGNSLTGMMPNLAGQHEGYLLQEMIKYKVHVRSDEMMTPIIDPLPENEIADLAKFYSIQTPSVPTASIETPPTAQQIAAGRMLYFTEREVTGLACADCHGDDGNGSSASLMFRAVPRIGGQQWDYSVSSLQRHRNHRQVGTLLGMYLAARNLTDEQITNLAAYLSTLK